MLKLLQPHTYIYREHEFKSIFVFLELDVQLFW